MRSVHVCTQLKLDIFLTVFGCGLLIKTFIKNLYIYPFFLKFGYDFPVIKYQFLIYV